MVGAQREDVFWSKTTWRAVTRYVAPGQFTKKPVPMEEPIVRRAGYAKLLSGMLRIKGLRPQLANVPGFSCAGRAVARAASAANHCWAACRIVACPSYSRGLCDRSIVRALVGCSGGPCQVPPRTDLGCHERAS